MSKNRLDVLERFESLFDGPEPSFEGFLRRRDRKRRNQRIAAGVVAIAIFAAPVAWIAATGGRSDLTQTPATNGPTVTTAPLHPTGVGLFGLPPEGATPSAPEQGELVLGIGFGHTSGDAGRFSLHVYADGRVIWQRLGGGPGEPSTGLIEQRLTPEGVDLVLAEVLTTGLFDHDRWFVGETGLHYGGVTVRSGDELVQLAWGHAGFEVGIGSVATTPTPEQVHALEQLDARLEDLTSWLPVRAWEDAEFKAFVPSRYQTCTMYTGHREPLGRLDVLDLLPAPVEDMLRPVEPEQSYPNGFRDSRPFWCYVVSTEQARELVTAMEDAGAADSDEEGWPSWRVGPSAEVVEIGLGPTLPHE